MLALDKGVPKVMTLKEMLQKYLAFQDCLLYTSTADMLRGPSRRSNVSSARKVSMYVAVSYTHLGHGMPAVFFSCSILSVLRVV